MKLVKGFLFALAGLFVMITLLSLLIPSNVVTAKSVTINAPRQKIINAINNFPQWEKWNPVFTNPVSNHRIIAATTGAEASIEWGENNKKNRITLTEQLTQGIRFTMARPGENSIQNSLLLLPLEDSTSFQVEWKALTHLKWYPWEKFAGIFISEITGPGYESALQSLKKYVESLP
jgi:hypothetical protein